MTTLNLRGRWSQLGASGSVGRAASAQSNMSRATGEEGGERYLSFSHELWRTIVLGTMLQARKRSLHACIATGLQDTVQAQQESEGGGNRRIHAMVTLFEHQRDAGNTRQAAATALQTGKRFEECGLSQYSYQIYNKALAMYCHPTAELAAAASPQPKAVRRRSFVVVCQHLLSRPAQDASSAAPSVLSLGASELEGLVRLNVEIGKVLANLNDSTHSVLAYQQAYKVWETVPAAAQIQDRTVVFPIISGICLHLKWGNILDDAACSYEKALVQRFVDESRACGDAVHAARAIAMQATLLARLGELEGAIAAQQELEAVYTHELSPGICKAYGSDRAAQNYGLSTQWYSALGMEYEARAQIEHVLAGLMPHMEARNVHNSFMILFPMLWELRARGEALRARAIFLKYVVDRFAALYDPGATTLWLRFYKPVTVLLGLAGGMWSSGSVDDVAERQKLAEWVLDADADNFAEICETQALIMGQSGKGIVAETCLLLAKLRSSQDATALALLRKGLQCAGVALDRTRADVAFANALKGVEPVLAELQALLARTSPDHGREDAADADQCMP